MNLTDVLHLPLSTGVFYALPFLVALTVIVFIHELGHFLVARWCGVDVDVFSIGFGREIFGWNMPLPISRDATPPCQSNGFARC